MRKISAGAILATLAVGALAAPASAHVSVNPSEASQGGFAKLAFRVPDEKDAASTTKVEVSLPADKPITFVSVRPLNGWTAQVDKTKLATPIKSEDGDEITEAVSRITWTASGDAAIQPGQFQEFEISAGPLPAADKVVFKALQTYSDGDVVRWIEETGADGKEPEHPAPTLKLAKKAAGGGMHDAADTAEAPMAGGSDRSDRHDGLPVALGAIGLVAGLGGLLLGFLAYRRSGSRPPTAA
jgi:periplasmic copper chaperone A